MQCTVVIKGTGIRARASRRYGWNKIRVLPERQIKIGKERERDSSNILRGVSGIKKYYLKKQKKRKILQLFVH